VHLTFSIRLLIVLAAGLMAIIVGMTAGVMANFEGKRVSSCIVIGGATFSTALTLLLMVLGGVGALY
jgi:ABC-type dipeptide/oligopeptide/nickel transport system permease subunit